VLVFLGAKGGVGTTTLATNLAFAVKQAQRDAALVDLDTFSGDLAVFLNLNPTYTLRDIAADFRRLDSVFLQGTMTRHASGIELLAAPAIMPGEPPLDLGGEQVRAILDLLRTLHEVTVVDTAGVPSPTALAALTSASRVFLVTEPSIPSVRACLRTLEWLREEGVDLEAHVEIVMNKYSGKPSEVPPAEAAKTLKLPIRVALPRDEITALTALNSGIPLQEVRGGSALHFAVRKRYKEVIKLLAASGIDMNLKDQDGPSYLELELRDAWVWDIYRPGPARFVASVRVVTFKDVNVEEIRAQE